MSAGFLMINSVSQFKCPFFKTGLSPRILHDIADLARQLSHNSHEFEVNMADSRKFSIPLLIAVVAYSGYMRNLARLRRHAGGP